MTHTVMQDVRACEPQASEKHTDGKEIGKHWRMKCCLHGKHHTVVLRVCPVASLSMTMTRLWPT